MGKFREKMHGFGVFCFGVSMSRAGGVRLSDVRQMLQIVGESNELPRGSVQQRVHLVAGLAELLRASLVNWGSMRICDPEFRYESVSRHGEMAEQQRAVFDAYFRAGMAPEDPSTPRGLALVREGRWPAVVLREQCVSDRMWYASAHCNEVRRPCGVDDCLNVLFPAGHPHRYMGMCFSRVWGDRVRFTVRDRAILELMIRETGQFLIEAAKPSPEGLSPRGQGVLRLLKGGLSEKEIAHALGLSPHTVHDYIKVIYKRYHVNNRASLMALWL